MVKKDYTEYSKEELAKIYYSLAVKERKLNDKIHDIQSEIIEVAKLLTKKVKDNKPKSIKLRQSSSYKYAMKYKASLSQNEQQQISNEVQEEINRNYDE